MDLMKAISWYALPPIYKEVPDAMKQFLPFGIISRESNLTTQLSRGAAGSSLSFL